MQPLKDYKKAYEDLSAKASEINRQLCLAGIAVAWLFRATQEGQIILPGVLVIAAFLFAIALILDGAMYLSGSIVWRRFYDRQYEQKESQESTKPIDDMEVELDEAAIRGRDRMDRFYYSKFVPTVLAYVLLLVYVIGVLTVS